MLPPAVSLPRSRGVGAPLPVLARKANTEQTVRDDARLSSGASVRAVSAETTGSARNTGPRVDVRPGPIAGDIRLGEGHAAHCAKPAATSSVWLLWAGEVVVGDHAVLDRGLSVQVAVRDEAAPGAFVPRDRWRIKVGSSSRNLGGARLGGAGGEEAEVVGEGAVGVVGDACAQDGDRLGR